MAVAGRVGLWTQFQLMPGWLIVAVWGLGLYLLQSQALGWGLVIPPLSASDEDL